MRAAHRKHSNSQSQKRKPIVVTAGHIFSDAVIDLVASTDPCRPNLILWDGHREQIAPEICHAGSWYRGPVLHPSIARYVRFPRNADRSGSAIELFATVSDWLQEYLAVPRGLADQITLWQASTWLSDKIPSPPALFITGQSMRRAIDLFKLLGCASRRALALTGISRATLAGLPTDLNLTFLISQPGLSRSLSQLLSASNYRGIHVPGNRGVLQDWVGSRAIYLGSTWSQSDWSGEGVSISLSMTGKDLRLLDEQKAVSFAEQLQARFLGFRLNSLWKAWEAGSAVSKPFFPGSETAQSFVECVAHEPELREMVTPILRGLAERDIGRREGDASVVILEVLWDPAHHVPKVSVTKINELLNVLLRTRGSRYEHSPEEVGWILSNHGFDRDRDRDGMMVKFSRENTGLLHRLVRDFGLNLLSVQVCSDCTGSKPPVTASV